MIADKQLRSQLTWWPLCITLFSLFYQTVDAQHIDQRVKLSDIHTITLFKDRFTINRRLSPIPQLRCVGSYWKCQEYAPSVVQCFNKGYDGIDVQWECKAPDLDKSVKFGVMKVICEGYSFAEDPYILADSCGLEYSLESTRNNRNYDYYNSNLYETSKLSNFLTLLIMIVIIMAVYKTCNKNRELELRREINGTYAHVIDGPIGDIYQHPHIVNSGASYTSPIGSLFPPPPPPYGSLVTSSSVAQSSEPSSTVATAGSTSGPAAATTIPSSSSAPPEPASSISEPDKPDESPNTPSASTWGNFLAGTAVVSGYLLNRRNTSPRRSDSPPPTYEETRGFQTNTTTPTPGFGPNSPSCR